MVKIFVGNLPRPTTADEIRALFEKYGSVSECDLIKNYGFVHMKDREAAKEAIENLHHYKLHGVSINVEASKSVSKSSTKLHVGNVAAGCTSQELQAKFEEYGTVLECDIVKDYAFVHMERSEDAMEAIRGLDGTEFKGYRSDPFLLVTAHRVNTGFSWLFLQAKECTLFSDLKKIHRIPTVWKQTIRPKKSTLTVRRASQPDAPLVANPPNPHVPGHYGQFRMASPSNVHIYGLREETHANTWRICKLHSDSHPRLELNPGSLVLRVSSSNHATPSFISTRKWCSSDLMRVLEMSQ
ncbi:RNA-binding protein 14-like isoform X3 [Stegostoma tigrinum]|uniref:RNA-binding protein 14-like isoform X3 n=1 Tax=Stegostoma tigrinum TaxID=3053191 RepID=UPI00286FF889|nr:RNA-binding protein 14-like isoform X3 [Stegostoma tigrinum]